MSAAGEAQAEEDTLRAGRSPGPKGATASEGGGRHVKGVGIAGNSLRPRVAARLSAPDSDAFDHSAIAPEGE